MPLKVNVVKKVRIAASKRDAAERRRRIARMSAVWASGTNPGKGGGARFPGFGSGKE